MRFTYNKQKKESANDKETKRVERNNLKIRKFQKKNRIRIKENQIKQRKKNIPSFLKEKTGLTKKEKKKKNKSFVEMPLKIRFSFISIDKFMIAIRVVYLPFLSLVLLFGP